MIHHPELLCICVILRGADRDSRQLKFLADLINISMKN